LCVGRARESLTPRICQKGSAASTAGCRISTKRPDASAPMAFVRKTVSTCDAFAGVHPADSSLSSANLRKVRRSKPLPSCRATWSWRASSARVSTSICCEAIPATVNAWRFAPASSASKAWRGRTCRASKSRAASAKGSDENAPSLVLDREPRRRDVLVVRPLPFGVERPEHRALEHAVLERAREVAEVEVHGAERREDRRLARLVRDRLRDLPRPPPVTSAPAATPLSTTSSTEPFASAGCAAMQTWSP
jgi:hypothetical protein